MQKVKEGDYVSIIYEGMLASGEIFESSTEESPFEFVVGQNSVFPSFESGVIGMTTGEAKTITVNAEEAYGKRREELVQTLDRSALGDKVEPQPGMIIGMTIEKEGQTHQVPAMVMTVEGDNITIDYNHPLAGQDLLYKITIKSIAEDTGSTGSNDCGCSSDSCDCN